MPRRYTDAHVQVTLVAALDKSSQLEEYWWSVTPSLLPMQNPRKSGGNVKITWQLDARQLSGTPLSGVAWQSSGVVMNKDGGQGPVWKNSWGTPKPATASPLTCELTVGHAQPPDGGRFKYSLVLDVAGTSVVIDPEVEFDPPA